MYVWLGIDVSDQLTDLRAKAEAVDREMGFSHSCYTLPYHISVKMSFPLTEEQFPACLQAVTDYFQSLSPFAVEIRGMEWEETIAWIRMKDSPALNGIHDRLNTLLGDRFGVGLHPYDCDYKFHTTLFMDDDVQKVGTALARVADHPLPDTLRVSRFLIGTSPSGALGTYSVHTVVDVD